MSDDKKIIFSMERVSKTSPTGQVIIKNIFVPKYFWRCACAPRTKNIIPHLINLIVIWIILEYIRQMDIIAQ